MRRGSLLFVAFLFLALLFLLAYVSEASQAQSGQTFTVTVTQQDTHDFRGTQFYELRFADGGAVTVAGSPSVKFLQVLASAQGKQTVTIEAFALKRVER